MKTLGLALALALATSAARAAYTLTVSPEELVIVGEALGAMPYNRVAPVVGHITDQVRAQQTPVMPPPHVTPPPEPGRPMKTAPAAGVDKGGLSGERGQEPPRDGATAGPVRRPGRGVGGETPSGLRGGAK